MERKKKDFSDLQERGQIKAKKEVQFEKENEEETYNIKSNSIIELKQRGIQISWKSCQFTNYDRQ